LEFEIGISAETISRERRNLKLSFREFRKANPKAKRAYKPRPKKERVIKEKVIEPKVIVKKLKSEVKRAAMVKNKFEEYNAEKRKAEKAKELYKAMEAKKREDGFKWITRVGKHGIKETVFIKI